MPPLEIDFPSTIRLIVLELYFPLIEQMHPTCTLYILYMYALSHFGYDM